MDDASRTTGPGARSPRASRAKPHWLLRHRVSIPAPVAGFLSRPALAARCAPRERHLTLVVAPGGFGKTTLLAACCRDAVGRGVRTAWLTLDAADDPAALDAYVAYAFDRAGLGDSGPAPAVPDHPAEPYLRMSFLLDAVARHRGPVLLVLDEVERIADPGSAALLTHLVRNAPDNLSLAVSGRRLPPGLDVASSIGRGDSAVLTADDLRFAPAEVAEFFGNRLSQPELSRVVETSSGWPIALRMQRNETGAPPAESRVARDVMGNWIGTRLLEGIAAGDRQLLLDAGLLDWFDGELLDAVLDAPGGLDRLLSMRMLDGLLEPVPSGRGDVWTLHPTIRDYCARRSREDTPARYRSLHARVAGDLARRDRTVLAMRHAAEAGDQELAASTLLAAGGLRLWFREGLDRLIAADGLVADAMVERHPRLGYARAVAQVASGRAAAARRTLASMGRHAADEVSAAEHAVARAMIALGGGRPAPSDDVPATMADLEEAAAMPNLDPLLRGGVEAARCAILDLRAQFHAAAARGRNAIRLVGQRSPFLPAAVWTQLGQVAMARGRTADAQAWYRHALRLARKSLLDEPNLTLIGDALTRELAIEVGERADAGADAPGTRRRFPLRAYMPSVDVATEMARAAHGTAEALATVDEALESARRADLPALARHAAALRVSLLVDAGRDREAGLAWEAAALPDSDAECIDLVAQTWRELESVASARLRLLLARGQFAAGRRLGRSLLLVAYRRGLARTAMRARALCMKLEQRAGDEAAALAHVAAYVRLYRRSGYAYGMLREADAALGVLGAYLDDVRMPSRDAAARLRATLADAGPRFSDREVEILRLLPSRRDGEIAEALGITRHGVRYHVQRIFAKLGTNDRHSAARLARSLGIPAD